MRGRAAPGHRPAGPDLRAGRPRRHPRPLGALFAAQAADGPAQHRLLLGPCRGHGAGAHPGDGARHAGRELHHRRPAAHPPRGAGPGRANHRRPAPRACTRAPACSRRRPPCWAWSSAVVPLPPDLQRRECLRVSAGVTYLARTPKPARSGLDHAPPRRGPAAPTLALGDGTPGHATPGLISYLFSLSKSLMPETIEAVGGYNLSVVFAADETGTGHCAPATQSLQRRLYERHSNSARPGQ